MNKLHSLIPWLVLAFGFLYVAQNTLSRPKNTAEFDIPTFQSIPVSAHGRTKPVDTVALNNLMMISGKQTLLINNRKMSATEWYLELLTNTDVSVAREIFRIDHPGVLDLLGLSDENRTRFSYKEIVDNLTEIGEQAQLASRVKAKDRDPFQNAVLTLYQRLSLFRDLSYLMAPYVIPPSDTGGDWRSFNVSVVETPSDPYVLTWINMLQLYNQGNVELFNDALLQYDTELNRLFPVEMQKARIEVVFNHAQPFYKSMVLYVIAFLLGCFGMLSTQLSRVSLSNTLLKSMTSLIVVAFIVHTVGLIGRMYLQGRPPVTNLYSSAVFIGWFCVLIGLLVDKRMKLGFAGTVASALGFGSLVIAHNLGGSGDTMEMMQAVLDSNFWLATHVVVITIGYSATFFAGLLGTAYVLLGVFTKLLDKEHGKSLIKMIYGVICFAALMSFLGTVLGGIWADQSWGRFWGWDAKENGAAMIVLMTLLILHARWCGMIRDRGIVVLAISCNIVTAWSWFGTNMLGVGLHSYGFTESAVFWLLLYVISQLLLMGVGMLPISMWRSGLKK